MARARKKATPARSSAAARVYSYLRFSNIRQKSGTSIQRQEEYALTWAHEHGMELDRSLMLRDEGRSAYHEDHVTKGAFGEFLREVEAGHVPPGSVLIVESMDRMSRATVISALTQLLSIISRGITVVTMADKREYSQDGINENPFDLMFSIMLMVQARTEIASRAKRIRAAARTRATNWIEKNERKRVAVGKDPGWVEYDNEANEYRFWEPFKTPLLALIGFFRQGYSMRCCFDQLTAAGIHLPPDRIVNGKVKKGGLANTMRLHEIIQNRALIGEKVIQIEGQDYPMPNYYPALMTEAEFVELQALRTQRGRTAGTRSEIVSFLTGMRLTYCMKCRSAIANQNILKGRSLREDGLPQDGHRRLYCTSATQSDKTKRCGIGSVSIVPVERAIMDYCSDQIKLTSLFVENDDIARNLNGLLVLARGEVEKTKAQIDRINDAIAISGGELPSLVTKLKELEAQLRTKQANVAKHEFELVALDRTTRPAMADRWLELRDDITKLDTTARTQARQLVLDTFKRIDIKPVTERGEELIELRLTSKHDVIRGFRIDRKTGAWHSEVIVDDPKHQALKPRRQPRARKPAVTAVAA
ncbi:recombinase family protein [Caballeronia sp. INML1]|uniref:recombinase family protein n=1 Tax=Caballeronia sp. INML1 TaxID=2921760 RepID=UPI0020286FE3|nr:recombinase family protein [Caballeronia sp. INML1]